MASDQDRTTATRRTVVGSMSALAVAGGGATAAPGETPGKVYGVYTGKDLKSYLCELTGGGSIPAYRMFVSGAVPPTARPDFHVSTFWGTVTIILAGELEVGVSAGPLRSVIGRAGDTFILIDTQGDGHTAALRGDVPFQEINVRLKEPWTALSKAFAWPDNILPPKESAPAVNF